MYNILGGWWMEWNCCATR